MTRDVEDIVGAAHDEQVAVLVDEAAVPGEVVAVEGRQVSRDVALVVVPQRREGAGGHGQLDADGSLVTGGRGVALLVEDPDVVAGHRHRGRAGLDRHRLQTAQVGGDRPAGLGLPPVVDDRDAEPFAGPLVGVGVEPLAGEEEGLQGAEVVLAHQLAVRVLLLDRAVCGGRREHRRDLVVADDPEEGARVGSADRLAFVQDRGGPGEEGCVDDVGVADDPSDVGRGEPHVPGTDVVDVRERPPQRDGVPAVVADDALGAPGRAGGVEDVERIGGRHLDAVDGLGRRTVHQLHPVEVPLTHLGGGLLALEDDAPLRLVAAALDGGIEERLVVHDPARFDAT